jgi:hypothetical protein
MVLAGVELKHSLTYIVTKQTKILMQGLVLMCAFHVVIVGMASLMGLGGSGGTVLVFM